LFHLTEKIKMLKPTAIILASVLTASCASMPEVPAAARAELAPQGKLRAGMNLGNNLFTGKDKTTGELQGVSVDLMRELAARLGVPVDFVVHAMPGDVADASTKGTWDVAILAIEQSRAKTITFSPPITEIEASYMVRNDSPLRTAAQVDAAGIRIAAPDKAGYELYLTRTIRHATLVRAPSIQGAVDVFNEKRADTLSGLKPNLLDLMEKNKEVRLLEGNFMVVNHGLGTPANKAAAAAYLKAFVEDMNASGFVARSIARHRVQGLNAVK
jgi:polar amino acid transport system substrate-binding protein